MGSRERKRVNLYCLYPDCGEDLRLWSHRKSYCPKHDPRYLRKEPCPCQYDGCERMVPPGSKWCIAHKEYAHALNQAAYRAKNLEKCRATVTKWRQSERGKEWTKKYNRENREEILQDKRDRWRSLTEGRYGTVPPNRHPAVNRAETCSAGG